MAKGGTGFLRILGWAAGLGVVAVGGTAIALKLMFPPEKIKAIVVDKAGDALHREVRLHGVSFSLVKGLVLDGLEVSENPDFKAGKFLAVNEFILKIQLKPLLQKKIVVDEIEVVHPIVSVIKDKKGGFNFDDLSEAQPASAPAKNKSSEKKKTEAAPVAFELKVRRAAVTGGKLEYTDKGSGTSLNLSGLDLVAKDFDFDQASGRLSAILERVAGGVAGLELTMAGGVSLDKKKAELKNWHGKFDGADLKLSLTAKDYLKAPDVELDASLSELDLDRLLAAKQKISPQPSASPRTTAGNGQSTTPGSAAPAPQGPPLKTKGQAVIAKMSGMGAKLNETKVSWELTGVTPDMKGVAGWAKLHVAGGAYEGTSKPDERKGIAKALMAPLTVLSKIGKLLPIKILPDFSHITFTEIVGDYGFSRGVMTIKDFHMDSSAAGVKTTGSADLGAQTLNLIVTASPANLTPLVIDVTGTFDDPKPHPRLPEILAKPVEDLGKTIKKALPQNLQKTADDLLKGLFHK